MPNPKRSKSKGKKFPWATRVAVGDPHSSSPAVRAAEARIKTANSVQDLSLRLEAFLTIDLPGPETSTGKRKHTLYIERPDAGMLGMGVTGVQQQLYLL